MGKLTVKLNTLNQGCYAEITDTRNGKQGALVVLLPPGKGACTALEERASEFREKALRYARYAELCENAAASI